MVNNNLPYLCLQILILSHLILIAADNAYACEPGVPSTPKEVFDASRVVFTGKVLEVRRLHTDIRDINAAIFEVDRYWKSAYGYYKELVVLTGVDDGTCGYPFKVGKEYLVYGRSYSYDDDMLYFTWWGSRTAPIEDASEDLSFLGEGIMPMEHVSVEEQLARFDPNIKEKLSLSNPKAEIDAMLTAMGVGMAIAGATMILFIRRIEGSKGGKG